MWAECFAHVQKSGPATALQASLNWVHCRNRGSLWAGGTLCLCRQGGLLRPSWLCCNMPVLHMNWL